MVTQNGNSMIFKVNRPSFMTKSNFVENVLKMRDQINNFLCTNVDVTGQQYEKIIRNFISANLRETEAQDIIKKVPDEYKKELEKLQEMKKEFFKDKDEDQAYFIAWDNAYIRANKILDRYYRIKGNELRIGVISKYGFNPDGIEVQFDDAEIIEKDSLDITTEASANGP